MVAFPRIVKLSGATGALLCGVMVGALTALVVLLMPATALEALVWRTGLAAVLAAAHPPLGTTARLLLAGGGGIVAAAVGWSALYLLFGPGGWLARAEPEASRGPVVRRADRHRDAPPRPPMTAADLGTPLMEFARPPVEQPLPRDLDQPLAAFDPAALPPEPRIPPRRVAPLAHAALAPGERIETFELTPVAPAARTLPAERRAPASPQTIEALLRRLEAGAERRAVGG